MSSASNVVAMLQNIKAMAGEENVRKAVLVFQSDIGIFCEQWSPEDKASKADMLGLLRVAQLGVEHDLVESWKED